MDSHKKNVTCRFVVTPSSDEVGQIIGLYREQGWWQPSDDWDKDLLKRLIAGSHCFVVAEKVGNLVGMGRVISDGVSDAYIQDLVVSPSHRNQGIARMILDALLERLRADGIPWIGLIAEPGSRRLYQGAGFREMSGFVPMLMMRE